MFKVTNLQKNLSENVQIKTLRKGELISRFIFSSRQCSGGRVNYAAFLPPSERLEISVYRIQDLSEEEIWEIDNQYVSGLRGKTSYGRADLNIDLLDNLNLTIDPNGTPHPRHANVYFSEGMLKENLKLIAMKLADASIFVPRK